MAHPDKKLPNLNTAAQNIQKEIRSSTKKPQKKPQMNINPGAIFAYILSFLIIFLSLYAAISQIRENRKIDDTSTGITETESIPESEVTMYAEINGIKMEDGGTYTVNPGDIIEVEASSINARIAFVGYYWDSKEDKIKDEYGNHLTITVPDNEPGNKNRMAEVLSGV